MSNLQVASFANSSRYYLGWRSVRKQFRISDYAWHMWLHLTVQALKTQEQPVIALSVSLKTSPSPFFSTEFWVGIRCKWIFGSVSIVTPFFMRLLVFSGASINIRMLTGEGRHALLLLLLHALISASSSLGFRYFLTDRVLKKAMLSMSLSHHYFFSSHL